jgi:hypothetical protein
MTVPDAWKTFDAEAQEKAADKTRKIHASLLGVLPGKRE